MAYQAYYPHQLVPPRTLRENNVTPAGGVDDSLLTQEMILTGVAFGLLGFMALLYFFFCCSVCGARRRQWPCVSQGRYAVAPDGAEDQAPTPPSGHVLLSAFWVRERQSSAGPPPTYAHIYGSSSTSPSSDIKSQTGKLSGEVAVWRVLVECCSMEQTPQEFHSPSPGAGVSRSPIRTTALTEAAQTPLRPPRYSGGIAPRTNPRVKFDGTSQVFKSSARRNIFHKDGETPNSGPASFQNSRALPTPGEVSQNSSCQQVPEEPQRNDTNATSDIKVYSTPKRSTGKNFGDIWGTAGSPSLILTDRSGRRMAGHIGLKSTISKELNASFSFEELNDLSKCEGSSEQLSRDCTLYNVRCHSSVATDKVNDTGYSSSSNPTTSSPEESCAEADTKSNKVITANHSLLSNGPPQMVESYFSPASGYSSSKSETENSQFKSVSSLLNYNSPQNKMKNTNKQHRRNASCTEMVQMYTNGSPNFNNDCTRGSSPPRIPVSLSNEESPGRFSWKNDQWFLCITPPPAYAEVKVRVHLPSGMVSEYIPAKKSSEREGSFEVEMVPHSTYPIQACSIEVSCNEEVAAVRIECLTSDRNVVECFQYGKV